MVTLDELKHMKDVELEGELARAHLELYKLSISIASRQSKETSKLKALRKYIALVKTIKRALAVEKIRENPSSTVTK